MFAIMKPPFRRFSLLLYRLFSSLFTTSVEDFVSHSVMFYGTLFLTSFVERVTAGDDLAVEIEGILYHSQPTSSGSIQYMCGRVL